MPRSSQIELSDLSHPLSEFFKQKSSPDDEVPDRDSKEAYNMWSIYEREAGNYDREVTKSQKTDVDSVMVFTGLFSATVALFIVESYKGLSPDSGEITTALLYQISQQLASFPNNTSPLPEFTLAFSPSPSIILVNALWFLSLVIAIVSAFYLMLAQEWIRRYNQKIAELSSGQERVRSCLFIGAQKYKMSHAIGLILLPLHISVFLFFAGFIIFLFTISNTIAIIDLIAVVFVVFLYATLTILPITDDSCPYFTPLSEVGWYMHLSIITAAASAYRLVVERFCKLSGSDEEAGENRLSKLSEFLEKTSRANKDYLEAGFGENIFRHVKKSPIDVDLNSLTWLLQRPIMGNKGGLQAFIDSIPPQILVHLSSVEAGYGKKNIRDHLFSLFQDCLNSKDELTTGPERDRRLQTCLHALYQIVKPSSLHDRDLKVIHEYLWSNFNVLKTVQQLWDDDDDTIRIFSRSICAHLSRNILRNRPGNLEQSWLRAFVGKEEDEIFDPQAPDHLSKWDHIILESFIFGILPCLEDGLFTRPEHATCFVETLAVLMNAGNSGAFSKDIFSEEIFSFIEWARESDREGHEEVVVKLKQLFEPFLADATTD